MITSILSLFTSIHNAKYGDIEKFWKIKRAIFNFHKTHGLNRENTTKYQTYNIKVFAFDALTFVDACVYELEPIFKKN